MSKDLNEEISRILRIPARFRLEKHINSLISLTNSVEFFSKISAEYESFDVHSKCCSVMTLEQYSPADIIVNFGEIGEKFYIILEGSVEVLIPVKKKIKVSTQDLKYYQSNELNLSNSSENLEAFDSIPLKKERREGVSVVAVSDILKSLQKDKLYADMKNENQRKNSIDEEIFLKKLFKDNFRKETRELLKIIKNARSEYIEIEVDNLEKVSELKVGASFGELALISDRPRSATIIAKEKLSLLAIHKDQFQNILGGIAKKRLKEKLMFLRSLIYFRSWTKSALTKISMYFNPMKFQRNQYMMVEGQEAKELFFVKDGEFLLTKRLKIEADGRQSKELLSSARFTYRAKLVCVKNKHLRLCIKGKSETIGGYEILNKYTHRVISSICVSSVAQVYSIKKEHFFNRIPQLDTMKDVIIVENNRIDARIKELLSTDYLESPKVASHSKSPTPNHLAMVYKRSFIDSPMTLQKLAEKPTQISKEKCFRKLTPREIDRALGENKSFKRASSTLIKEPVRKIIPPPNFMLKSREFLKVKSEFLKKLNADQVH